MSTDHFLWGCEEPITLLHPRFSMLYRRKAGLVLALVAVPIRALWFGVLARHWSDFPECPHLPHTDLAPERFWCPLSSFLLGKTKYLSFYVLQVLNQTKGSRPKPILWAALNRMFWGRTVQWQDKIQSQVNPLSRITWKCKGLRATCFYIIIQFSCAKSLANEDIATVVWLYPH